MNPILRHALATAGVLMVFTAVGTFLLTGTFEQTKQPIEQSEREAKRNLLGQVVPPSMHDNDLLQDSVQLPPAELLGQDSPSIAYRARVNGKPTAVILEAIAPDGYSGAIKLLIGITPEGKLTAVRVLAHKETPGLGDYIELSHSNWIKNFDGKSLAKEGVASGPGGALQFEDWKVRKDGGEFDYMAGATITPRAVVKAVRNALVYFAQTRDTIFPAASENPQSQIKKEET
jgi:electron transport complex protein RnfG